MKVKLEAKFLGCEARQSFKDPSRMVYVVALTQGLDTLRCYCNADEYVTYARIEPYADVDAILDYNPVSGRVSLSSIAAVS